MLEERRVSSGMDVLLARPEAKHPRPAVVLIHERYGIVQHQRDLAERLASEGYVACLPNLFHRFDGDREALERGDITTGIRDDEALADLDDAIAFLRDESYVSGDDIGIIGVCQSGRQPMLYAANRRDVASIVVMYGGVGKNDWESNEARPATVTDLVRDLSCPVLGLFGEEDHVVAVEEVERYRDELERARKSYRIRVYRGAPHGWLNDTMPGRYRREQAEESWGSSRSFFARPSIADGTLTM